MAVVIYSTICLSIFHPLQLLNEKQKLQAMKKHLNISSSDQDDLIYKSELSSVNVTTPPTPSSSSSSSSAFQVTSLGKPLPLYNFKAMYLQIQLIMTFVLIGSKSQPATPIGATPSTGPVFQAVYTDTSGQPVYIVNPQPTLIPLQLQQSPLPVAQPTTPQVFLISRCMDLLEHVHCLSYNYITNIM